MPSVLIIDDEADIRALLTGIFEDEEYQVLQAAHSEQALALIGKHEVDIIILDIWLDNSDMDGIQILKTLKKNKVYSGIPVLMISGHGNIEMAVNAMKLGAFDFIEKPFKIDHILLAAQRAYEQKQLQDENKKLKADLTVRVSNDANTGQDVSFSGHERFKYNAPYKQAKDQFERDYLTYMIYRHDGHVTQMAEAIGMERTALHRKLKSLNIVYEPETVPEAARS
jgi:DNA-binding NtrC family response regulator